MYKFISPTGEVVRTKTVKEFSQQTGITYSHARDLACGYNARVGGWCSMAPRAKKHRKRFLTVLIHPRQGKREMVGQSVSNFAKKHSLCVNELYKLVNGRKICYRGWMLETSYELAQNGIVFDDF